MLSLRRKIGRDAFVVAIILAWFLLTRCLLFAAAHCGAASMSETKRQEWTWRQGASDLQDGPAPSKVLAPLVRWDAYFYVHLARSGYPAPLSDNRPIYSLAFFPAYPLAVRALTYLVGDTFAASLLLSNLCALGAAFFVYRLGRTMGRLSEGVRAALLFLASPGAHFLSLSYTEGLFALSLAAALFALARRRTGLAALAGGLASATRSAGIVISLLILVDGFSKPRSALKLLRAVLLSLVASSGLLAFALFCHSRYSDALAFAHIQAHYDRGMSFLGPVRALFRFNVDPDYYLLTLLTLSTCVLITRRRQVRDAIGAWFLCLLPMMTGTLKAMIRYQATNIPLFPWAVRFLPRRRFGLVLVGSLSWMCLEMFLYSKGHAHY